MVEWPKATESPVRIAFANLDCKHVLEVIEFRTTYELTANNEIQHANVFMIGFTTCVECPINQIIIQDLL